MGQQALGRSGVNWRVVLLTEHYQTGDRIDRTGFGHYFRVVIRSSSPGGIVAVPTLYLNKIQDVAQVSEGKAKKLMETCVWCLVASKHKNGVTLQVDSDRPTSFYAVSWPSKLDLEAINRSFNKEDAVEEGAEAVALLIAVNGTEFNGVERASTSTGIDYWLGHKDNPNNPFKRAGRLEISGIFEETETNKVKTRLKKKLEQTSPSDKTFSVYVIIVEFSKPYATMVLKK